MCKKIWKEKLNEEIENLTVSKKIKSESVKSTSSSARMSSIL